MEGGALHDPLETVGRLRLVLAVDHQVLELGVEIVDDRLSQHLDVHAARPHHRSGVRVVDQREQ